MTDNDAIAAILKSGKEIPVLNLGVDHTAIVESVFPVREHPHLLRHGGKAHNTGFADHEFEKFRYQYNDHENFSRNPLPI